MTDTPILHLDYETKSAVDLTKCGAYRYAQSPTTDILCMAYAFGDDPVRLWTPDFPFPQEIAEHIKNGYPIYAHNAQFERLITQYITTPRYGCPPVALEQWYCTAAMAAAMALPRSLDGLGAALKLPIQKDMAGSRLMLKMSKPRAVDEDGVRWWDTLEITGKKQETKDKQVAKFNERLEGLYAYCINDVETERLAEKHLYPLSPEEREVYLLDQRINDRGISVDLKAVKAAIKIIEKASAKLEKQVARITKGAVTSLNQRDKIIEWCASRGITMLSLDKQNVAAELAMKDLPHDVRQVLYARQVGGKSSTAKLKKILEQADEHGRIHGNLLYHGATTGRFSGRGVQLQNLPKPEILGNPKAPIYIEPEDVIPYILKGDDDEIDLVFGPPFVIVADTIRSMVTAAEGKVLYAADFSQIEVRVLAWLAGQNDLLEGFINEADIYVDFASKIYGRKIDKKVDPKARQLGKLCVLGLGFQMGASKFKVSCTKENIVVSDEEAARIVKLYRSTYSKISSFWWNIEKAAIRAVRNPNSTITLGHLKFKMRDGNLRMRLPSGRVLNYPNARIERTTTPWGEQKDSVVIKAQNTLTRKWEDATLTPGILAENATQAVARDVMVEAMFRAEEYGYDVLLTVHDELIAEILAHLGSVEEFERIVARVPKWAPGLPIKAEGWRNFRYKK
jgi:DNA polymerase